MRRFVLGWKKRGVEARFGAKIVSYADDFVICCKGSAEQAMTEMRRLMEQLKLMVNETKTHIRELPQDRFDFLGYSFGRYYTPRTGQAYLCPQPSKKSVQRQHFYCGGDVGMALATLRRVEGRQSEWSISHRPSVSLRRRRPPHLAGYATQQPRPSRGENRIALEQFRCQRPRTAHHKGL